MQYFVFTLSLVCFYSALVAQGNPAAVKGNTGKCWEIRANALKATGTSCKESALAEAPRAVLSISYMEVKEALVQASAEFLLRSKYFLIRSGLSPPHVSA